MPSFVLLELPLCLQSYHCTWLQSPITFSKIVKLAMLHLIPMTFHINSLFSLHMKFHSYHIGHWHLLQHQLQVRENKVSQDFSKLQMNLPPIHSLSIMNCNFFYSQCLVHASFIFEMTNESYGWHNCVQLGGKFKL
jgi:hypothetical protein